VNYSEIGMGLCLFVAQRGVSRRTRRLVSCFSGASRTPGSELKALRLVVSAALDRVPPCEA
jgi:hypothetical protein